MEENFNIHLGRKLRMRRLSLGLTQTKVAQAINVTFQQIQKYEKGTNGVSSNRLMQLSQFLKVPIIYFFEDFKEFKDLNSSEEINELKLDADNIIKLDSQECIENSYYYELKGEKLTLKYCKSDRSITVYQESQYTLKI